MKPSTVRILYPLLSALLVSLIILSCSPPEDPEVSTHEGEEELKSEGVEQRVQLFFPTSEGRLRAEDRNLVIPNTTRSVQLEALIRALLEGPENPALLPLFHEDVDLDTAYLSEEGLAWILLVSPRLGPDPSGVRWEMARLYSLVNSVQHNLQDSQGVLLLWNGRQPETFAGHIDTTRPLRADPSLVEAP